MELGHIMQHPESVHRGAPGVGGGDGAGGTRATNDSGSDGMDARNSCCYNYSIRTNCT